MMWVNQKGEVTDNLNTSLGFMNAYAIMTAIIVCYIFSVIKDLSDCVLFLTSLIYTIIAIIVNVKYENLLLIIPYFNFGLAFGIITMIVSLACTVYEIKYQYHLKTNTSWYSNRRFDYSNNSSLSEDNEFPTDKVDVVKSSIFNNEEAVVNDPEDFKNKEIISIDNKNLLTYFSFESDRNDIQFVPKFNFSSYTIDVYISYEESTRWFCINQNKNSISQFELGVIDDLRKIDFKLVDAMGNVRK